MGNCQAIENSTLVIQHPSGRVNKLYWPVTASHVMETNPGHYVALLLTTTVSHPPTAVNDRGANNNTKKNNVPVRITRIKLLRPTDTLVLGHVYRLVTTQEVSRGLRAKKYAKMKKQHPELVEKHHRRTDKLDSSDFDQVARRPVDKNQLKHEKPTNQASGNRSRAWQPALQSISESAS